MRRRKRKNEVNELERNVKILKDNLMNKHKKRQQNLIGSTTRWGSNFFSFRLLKFKKNSHFIVE